MLTNQQELLFYDKVHLREPLVGLFFHFGTEQGGQLKKSPVHGKIEVTTCFSCSNGMVPHPNPIQILFLGYNLEVLLRVDETKVFWQHARCPYICICCILNIIRFTVKSISSLLRVSSTSAVNEAKMKRTKIFRFEVWDESVWQHLIGDKSIRQAEKNPSGNIW